MSFFSPLHLAAPIVAQGGGQEGAPGWLLWGPLVLMMVMYYFLLIRPQGAERKRREELLKSLKKNDRVVTTSGMIGTVANVSQDGKEVTLKFGDTVRIPFLRSAIETVLKDPAGPGDGTAAKHAAAEPAATK